MIFPFLSNEFNFFPDSENILSDSIIEDSLCITYPK